MEARVSPTLFLKASSRKALGPWLYAAFISAVNEVGVDDAFEWLSGDLNLGGGKRENSHFYIKT